MNIGEQSDFQKLINGDYTWEQFEEKFTEEAKDFAKQSMQKQIDTVARDLNLPIDSNAVAKLIAEGKIEELGRVAVEAGLSKLRPKSPRREKSLR